MHLKVWGRVPPTAPMLPPSYKHVIAVKGVIFNPFSAVFRWENTMDFL